MPQSLIFSDWKKMIDETKPDIVWAFTPTNGHVDVVRYCAPKGIHVMMEKPLAATYKEALEMQALAKKYNTLVDGELRLHMASGAVCGQGRRRCR